mgnify:CR=1 FL=1
MLKIEINVDNYQWKKAIPDFSKHINQAAKKTIKSVLKNSNPNFELSILLTSDKEIKRLNKLYRNKNKKTNVLAFPMNDNINKSLVQLGDIVVSLETIIVEAKKFRIARKKYLCKIIIHGLLHILGYDHIDDNDFFVMDRLEKEILNKID